MRQPVSDGPEVFGPAPVVHVGGDQPCRHSAIIGDDGRGHIRWVDGVVIYIYHGQERFAVCIECLREAMIAVDGAVPRA